MSREQYKQLLQNARKSLKANPRDTALHEYVASLYEQLEEYDEALSHLSKLMSSSSAPDEVLVARYARALRRTGALAKSQQVVEEGLRRFPASGNLLRGKALTALLMSEYEKARQAYAALFESDNSDVSSASMAGAMKLLMTDLNEGFEEYSLRPMDRSLMERVGGIPRWSGEPLTGKRLLLWPEQGVGDVIMFLGLLPFILAQAPLVTIVVTAKLAPLVSRSFSGMTVVSEDGLAKLGSDFDYQIPLGDLMRFVLPSYMPADHGTYLRADLERTRELRERYLKYGQERGRKRLIGLSWHTTNPGTGFARNIRLSELQPLLVMPGIQFVSLQYGDHAEEIAECNRRCKGNLFLDDSVDVFNDLDGAAAQIAAMDEVISTTNTTVHMAGSLGIPTTVLLSSMSDWRWGLKRSENRWYKSVHLERQEAPLKWQPVIKRVSARLARTSDLRV